MNIEKLRSDYRAAKERAEKTQQEIGAEYNVPQASLSRFETNVAGLSFENVVNLWPFIYGEPFPEGKQCGEMTTN